MEAYVSALMDKVVARWAAKAAKATLVAAPAQSQQQPEGAPAPITRDLMPQRTASAGTSYFWSPSASRAAFPQPTTVGAGDVQPDQTWQGVQVISLAMQSNESLIGALSSGEVVEINPTTGVIVANYSSPDSSLQLNGLAASRSAAYLLLLDELYGNVYIDGVNVRTGNRISRMTLGYPTNLGGVDPSGRTVLTSAGGSAAVLYDTTTGARRGLLYNPAWNVLGVGLNPANSEVWVISQSNTTVSLFVLSAGSNSTRVTAQLPSTVAQVGSLSIDAAGQNAYVLYVTLQNNTVQFIIEHFNAQSGQSVRRHVLPSTAQPGQYIAAGTRPGEVYWSNAGIITVLSNDTSSTIPIGKYPVFTGRELPYHRRIRCVHGGTFTAHTQESHILVTASRTLRSLTGCLLLPLPVSALSVSFRSPTWTSTWMPWTMSSCPYATPPSSCLTGGLEWLSGCTPATTPSLAPSPPARVAPSSSLTTPTLGT
jgi:hypothetical protein